jgi:hypothetical protein
MHSTDAAHKRLNGTPSGHSEHQLDPLMLFHVPSKQVSQGPESGPVYPALHWQSVAAPLPGAELDCASGHAAQMLLVVAAEDGEKVPAAQIMHRADPAETLYVPLPQARQPLPSLVYPALHSQLLGLVLPLGDCELSGQAVHAPALVAALYEPAVHSTHRPPAASE